VCSRLSCRRHWGEKRFTWTITANGKATQIPLDIKRAWEVSPFIEATGNTPPYIGFTDKGPFISGPKGQSISLLDDDAESSRADGLGFRRCQ